MGAVVPVCVLLTHFCFNVRLFSLVCFICFKCEVILRKMCFIFCKSIKKIMLFKWVKLPSGCVVPGSCVLIVTFGCCFVNY